VDTALGFFVGVEDKYGLGRPRGARAASFWQLRSSLLKCTVLTRIVPFGGRRTPSSDFFLVDANNPARIPKESFLGVFFSFLGFISRKEPCCGPNTTVD
jgi:hypothetical protein